MIKRFHSIFFMLFCILLPAAGEAFVPQSSHLLHLVLEKIKQPVGIEAHQIKQVLNYEDPAKGLDTIEEKLIYVFPNQFRSQVVSDTITGFAVESDSKFIKVMDGQVVSSKKSPVDLYTDILLYRDHEAMLNQLILAGIDTDTVSFHRYNDTVCYVIGSPFAGLWIEKETLFPVKYVIQKNGWVVEFFYDNWKRVSKTWYPMAGSIFFDNQLFATINVMRFELKSRFVSSLFDFEHIKAMYPENQTDAADPNASQVDELDQSIENFKKLYE